MQFRYWLENEYQKLFPMISDEEPITPKQKQKLNKYPDKNDFVNHMMAGGRQTEKAAQSIAGSFINGGILGPEEIERIYPQQIVIPSKSFKSVERPERYLALVSLKGIQANPAGNFTHRLVALWQGAKGSPISKESILNNDHQIVGSIVYQNGYITHVWVDPEFKFIKLYGQMRDFLRQYYGIHGVSPDDNLTSRSYRGAEAKHLWNRYYGKQTL